VDTFCKHVHVVDVDPSAFARVAASVATLAEVEGLVEHARSVMIREES
jgi:histidinol dehydrogenase